MSEIVRINDAVVVRVQPGKEINCPLLHYELASILGDEKITNVTLFGLTLEVWAASEITSAELVTIEEAIMDHDHTQETPAQTAARLMLEAVAPLVGQTAADMPFEDLSQLFVALLWRWQIIDINGAVKPVAEWVL